MLMIHILIKQETLLKQMSQLLKNYVPHQFKIFRNGGEEFSIVIFDYSLDQSVKLENIRMAVENLRSIYLIRKL